MEGQEDHRRAGDARSLPAMNAELTRKLVSACSVLSG
jgi:hypothetical protein